MIRLKRTIHDVLSIWGASRRTLPPRADALKQDALSRVMPPPEQKLELPRHAPWFSFALGGLAVIVFFLSSPRGILVPSLTMPLSKETAVAELRGFAESKVTAPFPPLADRAPISDRRELIKTDYYARLRTRAVAEAWQRAQTLVRGVSGRIDSANISERAGYIAFAIPAEKLDGFRNELRTVVPLTRFFTENISSQNLLPEKRAIESQSDEVMSRLTGLRSERRALTSAHRGVVSKIQSQLAALSAELTKLRSIKTGDAAEQAKNAAREQELLKEESALRARLREENSSYNKKLVALNSQIGDAESQASGLAEQDQALRDTVATVAGTISIDWISVWQIIGLYLPGHWLSWFLLAAAVGTYLYHRRRQQLVLP